MYFATKIEVCRVCQSNFFKKLWDNARCHNFVVRPMSVRCDSYIKAWTLQMQTIIMHWQGSLHDTKVLRIIRITYKPQEVT